MRQTYYLCGLILLVLCVRETHGNTGKPWNTLDTTFPNPLSISCQIGARGCRHRGKLLLATRSLVERDGDGQNRDLDL